MAGVFATGLIAENLPNSTKPGTLLGETPLLRPTALCSLAENATANCRLYEIPLVLGCFRGRLGMNRADDSAYRPSRCLSESVYKT